MRNVSVILFWNHLTLTFSDNRLKQAFSTLYLTRDGRW